MSGVASEEQIFFHKSRNRAGFVEDDTEAFSCCSKKNRFLAACLDNPLKEMFYHTSDAV